MRYVVIDDKGNWKIVKENDLSLSVKNNFYSYYQLPNLIWKITKLSLFCGLTIGLIWLSKDFSRPDLQIAFSFIMLLNLLRMVRI